MTKAQMLNLQPGDLVRHKSSESAMVVTANYGTHITMVRTAELTNPIEWDLIDKKTGQPVE